METIQINKKYSSKLRMLLTLGILLLSVVTLSYFFIRSYQNVTDSNFIDENAIIMFIIFVIVVLPLILFLLPGSSKKTVHKNTFTKNRELVAKRRRKSVYNTLNSKTIGKLY